MSSEHVHVPSDGSSQGVLGLQGGVDQGQGVEAGLEKSCVRLVFAQRLQLGPSLVMMMQQQHTGYILLHFALLHNKFVTVCSTNTLISCVHTFLTSWICCTGSVSSRQDCRV